MLPETLFSVVAEYAPMAARQLQLDAYNGALITSEGTDY